VLIVEDDDDVRELVEHVLRRAGLVTDAVNGGLPALDAALRQPPPGLIVLDVEMADLNGLEVCRRLKADAGAPVLIVSGNVSRADIAAGYQAGCDDYLPKPFTAAELIRRVRRLLSQVA
jgi:DNA-binding response OmpR family regulator